MVGERIDRDEVAKQVDAENKALKANLGFFRRLLDEVS